jgi:muramidase (phage lysozyme)
MDPNMKAFLDMVAFSEGTSTHPLTQNNGYDVIVTSVNGPEVFTDYSDHPFTNRPSNVIRRSPSLVSTAAGRYQLLHRYWVAYKQQLNLPDFSPASQDAVAVQQIKERHADVQIQNGNITEAIQLCSNLWASLPGNQYGQGGKTLDALLNKFNELSGSAGTTTVQA